MTRERIDWLINAIVVPLASVAAGFLVAGVAVAATGADPLAAFTALFQGAITNRNAFPETLVSTVPYVFLGLGVALGFRAGLFNIGAEGQFYIGALTGVFVAYSVHGLPSVIEIPLALLAGMAGGFGWSAIAGFLKARFGAHEVITTIMLNYVAFLVANYLVDTPGLMLAPNVSTPRTPDVDVNAILPIIYAGSRLHFGFIVALIRSTSRLVPHPADHHRLRATRRRIQPRRGASRWDLGWSDHGPGHGPVRGAGRSGGHRPGAGGPAPHDRHRGRGLRL